MNKGLVVICVLAFISFIHAKSIRNEVLESFENKPTKDVFKAFHYAFERPYDLNSEIGLQRYRIFKENIKFIKQSNAENSKFKLGLGPFADMTYEEYAGKTNDLKGEDEINTITMNEFFLDDIDPTWNDNLPDWTYLVKEIPEARLRSGNWLDIKNCMLDGTFLTVTTLFELHMPLFKLPEKKLSRQSFYDCATFFNDRCGYYTTAMLFDYQFLSKAGLYTEEHYPLLETPYIKQECKKDLKYDYSAALTGCYTLGSTCTLKIKKEIFSKGPALTTIENNKYIQHFKSGVFDSKKCNDLQAGSALGIVIHSNKERVKVLFAHGEKYGNGGFVELSREFSERQVLGRFNRMWHACGAESELLTPYHFKYLN